LKIVVAALIVMTGCYEPSIGRCVYACAANRVCPNDLACNAEGMCALSETDRCTTPEVDSACGWITSNIDACAEQFDQIQGDWTIASNQIFTVDTTSATPPALPAGTQTKLITQLGATTDRALVIAVHDLTIHGTLEVSGRTPLILLASGTVTIDGTVALIPSGEGDAMCNGRNGSSTTTAIDGSGGGGGAAMGGIGAPGGEGGQQTGGPGGAASPGARGDALSTAQLMLTPLRTGCRGGKGGDAGSQPGGAGGLGGGAIQIGARIEVVLDGATIRANGDGGKIPQISQAGAGGGGSGGAILLEAPSLKLTNTRVCANGGGGAGTGGPGASGGVSDCGPAAARGGGAPATVDAGGNGATQNANAAPGQVGMGTNSPDIAHGGGGGGGGVGRIRFHGTVTSDAMSLVSPAPGP
jgi:hypothetical protein